jgi:hypothetical protein
MSVNHAIRYEKKQEREKLIFHGIVIEKNGVKKVTVKK